MSANKKLNDVVKDERSSITNSQSSPSSLNDYFNFDEVDNQQKPENIKHNRPDHLVLDATGKKLGDGERETTFMTKPTNDVLPKQEEENPKIESGDRSINGKVPTGKRPSLSDKSAADLSLKRSAETNDQNKVSSRRSGATNLPNLNMPSDSLQRPNNTPEFSGTTETQPSKIPKNGNVDGNAALVNEPKTDSKASTSSALKKTDAQNSSGKRRPSAAASHSLDLPEIHEFETAKENGGVKPKLSSQKASGKSSAPAEEEEKSLHNHIRRKIFSTAGNPFFQGLHPPESRIAARRFSEMDHRRVFEMPLWQRKLSQLFVPPSQEELRDPGEDSQKLLNGKKLPTIAPRRPSRSSKKTGKQRKKSLQTSNPADQDETDRLDVLDAIEGSDGLSDDETSSESTDEGTHNSTIRRDELKPLMFSGSRSRSRSPMPNSPDWEGAARDDTICSNRSSSFRRFYPHHTTAVNMMGQRPVDASTYNSIASLVREKNLKKVDAPEEKKKPPIDYYQLVVSIVLLTIIVILVSLIYHYYHLHILSVFIFDRIKIVEADRVMEVMSVNDATGYRAPLVKVRLGVEFPVTTKHTDCTDYLKYLIDVSGEIRKSEHKRKRRHVEEQISSSANSDSTSERTSSKRKINKKTSNSRRRKNMGGRKNSRKRKFSRAHPMPEAAALKSSLGSSLNSNVSNEVETKTESPSIWSIFTDIFTPVQAWTESPSKVSEVPQYIAGSKKSRAPTNPEQEELNASALTPDPEINMIRTTPPMNWRSKQQNRGPDPASHDERNYATAKTARLGKYTTVEIEQPHLPGIYSGHVLDEHVSVEDFPFGVYDSDPFQFEDHFSNVQCVDFKGRARLQLTHRPPLDDVDCFSVHWESSSPDLVMKDCFVMDRNTTGVWWGMGDVTGGAMPLTKIDEISDTVLYSGEILRNPVGGLLRRTWISSEGILVSVPFAAKALLSVNALHAPRREFCLHSERNFDFNHPNHREKLDLDYTLCVAPNVPSLLSKLGDIERMDNIEYATSKWHRSLHPMPDDVELYQVSETITSDTLREVANRFSCPVWRPWIPHNEGDIDQDDVMAYAESIVANVRDSCGFVLLPISWQNKLGSLDFDQKRFPNPVLLLESLRRKGLELALTLSSLIEVETPNFKNISTMDLLIRQVNSTLPILVSTSKTKSAAVLDFTNPNTVNWYASELLKLKQKYGIDRFHLTPTSTQSLPPFRRFYSSHPNPDYAIRQFIKAVSRVKAPISTNTAIIPVNPPTFLTANYGDASWEMLEMLPNRVLTISAVGGSLVDGGVVGGWSTQPGYIPDRELYIRSMGVSVFLPVMQISVLPSMYDSSVLSFTSELMQLREDLVIPRLRKNLNETLTNNLPLVSPLAMVFPKDLRSLPIGDQWFVGNDLMVAPVLKRGARARDIYLPPGIWKDGTYDKLLKGKRWLKNYRVMMGKVPHFILITPERGPRSHKNRREKQSKRPKENISY